MNEKLNQRYKEFQEKLNIAKQLKTDIYVEERKYLNELYDSFQGKYFQQVPVYNTFITKYFFVKEIIQESEDKDRSYSRCVLIEERNNGKGEIEFEICSDRLIHVDDLFQSLEITKQEFDQKMYYYFNQIKSIT